jgi:hypothetical protein
VKQPDVKFEGTKYNCTDGVFEIGGYLLINEIGKNDLILGKGAVVNRLQLRRSEKWEDVDQRILVGGNTNGEGFANDFGILLGVIILCINTRRVTIRYRFQNGSELAALTCERRLGPHWLLR